MGEAITYDNDKETCIEVHLMRSSLGNVETGNSFGLTINVKAHPRVEAFFKGLGGGEVVDVGTIGRYWHPAGDNKLKAYIITPLEQLRTDSGMSIGLDRLGQPLIETSSISGDEILNMSFLRLVGISSENGATFRLKTPYSYQGLIRLRDLIQNAQNRLYDGYLRPVEMTIRTTSQIRKM